jgi:hypothetical protein
VTVPLRGRTPTLIFWRRRRGAGSVYTDADGAFSYDLGDADAPSAGAATLRVRPSGSPLVESRRVQIPAAGSPPLQLVKVHSADEISATAGWLFLGLSIVFLVLLSAFYLDLHGVTVAKLRDRGQPIAVSRSSQISIPLADMLNVAKQQVAGAREALAARQPEAGSGTAAGDRAGGGQAAGGQAAEGTADAEAEDLPADGPPSAGDADAADAEADEAANPARQALQEAMVGESLKTARKIFADLQKSLAGLLDADQVAALDGLFAQADAALEAGAVDALDATLDRLLKQIEEERELFLWEDMPGRLLEVMFWALAATLLRLIFNAGNYLYKGSFLKSAIPQHLALLVIIPVVAVLIAFVLTLVSVDLKVGDTALKLDMSNILIAIVVAALIGLAPWRSWNFLHKLADLLFTSLAGLFKMTSDRPAADEDQS